MLLIFILILSILLQFTAAFLALRLVWVTKKTPAWVLIASAICLMALRRGLTLYQLLFWESPTPLEQTTELVALAVSILMVAGVASIAPLFRSIKRSEEMLRRQLMQTCMDGIIANDLRGNIFIFNETAAKIFGYNREDVLGKMNVRELYPPSVAREIKLNILNPTLGGEGILENYETMVRHQRRHADTYLVDCPDYL